ncbi:hypothetical protein E4T66_14470 [Sinimarinibacterium sp. CAU 1509]|uniref:alpha/beta hydrolase family protein n=1 Tax=Sinimarinibacterium sp. CAU 1509 TaxID=2562283 RepID=UPI0010AD9090|nr:hypothetical protein [Sinimarinibacterium sp. CAU 1509]TJY58803.1 hypothetical protein E4T66_14470 [Sinimarinibacterium sp. CAU 1509]
MKTKMQMCLSALSLLVLAACGDGSSSGNASRQVVTVESIVTNAAAIQAAAPATVGKSAPGDVAGLLAYVPGTAPTRLVVFCHGLGHTVEASWYPAVVDFADADTAVVTTNYRDNDQLPVLRAAHDTLAATLYAKQRFPSVQTVYLLGVSLGGAVSGTALVEAAHASADGRGLFDYWVDVEGLSNLSEAWAEGTAVVPEFAAYIEEETGGTPVTVPDEYVRRSPALRAQEMASLGLRAAVVVHDLNDGLVVTNQGHEMALALLTAGVPVQVFNVLRVGDGQDPGTTGTGALAGFLGLDDPNNLIRLAGHGSEADYAHPVIRTGFEQLRMMLDGTYDETTPYAEHAVDDG